MGQQAQIGFYKPYAPVSPWYPLSEMRLAAVQFKQPPYLKAVACRFGTLRAVPLLPVQSYPPKLVSSFNSITFLNAARSLCAVFQSAPERVCRISTFKKAKKNG